MAARVYLVISLPFGMNRRIIRLVLGMNSDTSIKRNKGNYRPINGEQDRAAELIMEAYRAGYGVFLFGNGGRRLMHSTWQAN